MTNLPVDHLGPYKIIERIRSGGMATVYKAFQPALERHVAIKVLHRHGDPQLAPRFEREARAVAQLNHPNILPIYDYGEQDGYLYLVMQYVENGTTLHDVLGGRIEVPVALKLIVRVLDALGYAHGRGIIHRDIKPGNVLLPAPGWPMLADFGIAKLANDTQLTVPGAIMGTVAYMPPEQAAGRPVDTRADLYSVGVMLYEMVTGRVPFDADTPMAVLTKHTYEPPPPPRSINPNLDAAIEAVLLRALEKDPAARYQTAQEMAEALEQLAGQPGQSPRRSQVDSIYQAGLEALEQGRWNLAVEHLTRLVQLDPRHEEGTELLRVAQEAQERAKAEARVQIDQIRQRRQSTTAPAEPTPQTAALGISSTTAPVAATAATVPPEAPARPAPRGRGLLWAFGGAALVLALLGLSRFAGLWPDQQTGPVVGMTSVSPIAATTAVSQVQNATSAPAPATALAGVAATAAPPATPQTELAPLPEPTGALVFEDDFNRGPAGSGLEDRVRAVDFSRGFHDPGYYHFKLSAPGESRWTLVPRVAYTNFSAQIELWDNSDAYLGSVAQGLVFRARDDTHFYVALVDPRAGRYTVRKASGPDTWIDLVPWTASPLVLQKAEHNVIRLDSSGDSFSLYLNGQALGGWTDGDYSYGMLGMMVANVDAVEPHMHFDNLKVWSDDAAPAPPDLPATREDPNGPMVLIPGGEFILGGTDKTTEQAHIVDLPSFYIDRAEVTNAAYAACVAAGGCTPQTAISSETHPSYAQQADFAGYPAIYVTWQQASAFCGWAGKRLPSEAEWEKAATWSFTDRVKLAWPWANSFDPARLNSAEAANGDTTPAGQYPAELNGTVDMAGNVSEWTSTQFQPYPYDPADGREDPQAAGDRVFRGGSWAQTQGKAQGYTRQPAAPDYAGREIGFRCAVTP